MSEYIYDTDGTPMYGLLGGNIAQAREPIVRCCDCKHRAGANVQAVVSDLCMWLDIIVKPDGFCAWGERRET